MPHQTGHWVRPGACRLSYQEPTGVGRPPTKSAHSVPKKLRSIPNFQNRPAVTEKVTEKVSEPPTPPTFHTTKCQEVMENSRQAKNRESAERSRGDKRQRLGDDECKRQNAAAEKARRKK